MVHLVGDSKVLFASS